MGKYITEKFLISYNEKKSPPRIQLLNDKDIEKIVLVSDTIPYVNFPHGIHKILTGRDFFQKLSRKEYTINLISKAFSIPDGPWSEKTRG